MKILLAADASSASEAVIQEVAFRPWPAGTEFNAVTVVDPFFFTRAPLLMEQAKKSTLETLNEQVKPLQEAGWAVGTNVILDNPRHALPRAAKSWRADLFVIGSHERGAVSRLLLGSTAQAVLRHADCSVEIVRPVRPGTGADSVEGMRVLIATDGSEFAEAALRCVADRPWPKGSAFIVVAAPEIPLVTGDYPLVSREQVNELAKSGHETAAVAMRTGTEMLEKAGLKACSELIEGGATPAQAILCAAQTWNAGLIVLGSHGRRGFDRLLLGSVSESVALHAHCSVEVIRRPAPLL